MMNEPFALLAETPPRGGSGLRIAQAIPSALSALLSHKGRSLLTTAIVMVLQTALTYVSLPSLTRRRAH